MFSLQRPVPYWFLSALCFAGYLLLPIVFPLLGEYNRAPLRDIRSFAPSFASGLAYAALFLLLYSAYTAAWRRVRHHSATLAAVVLPVLFFCLPLLFVYPINATDLFRYFIRGRVTAFYGESALTVRPSAFASDPYLPLAGEWAGETSPYGPLWELLAAAVTDISGQNLLIGLLLFKTIAVLAHIGIALAIWHGNQLQPPQQRAAYTLLWAWNPALLLMFAVDGHNDALMLLWLVAGYVSMSRRPLLGFLVAFLGALTKPIALLAMPLLFIAHFRVLANWRARWRFLLAAAAGTLLLTAVSFAPLGSPLELTTRLLTEASDAVGFSPGILVVLLAQRLLPGFDTQMAIELGAAAGLTAFAAFTLFIAWRAWHGIRVTLAVAGVFAAYLAAAFTFRIWYSVWPFAWLLLDGGQRRRALSAGYWFLFTSHLSLLIYGYVRVHLFAGDHLIAHLIGVPFTFALPLLLAYKLPLARADHL